MQDLTPQSSFRYYRAFFEELRRLGYIEGQNLVVERFTAEGRTEHYPELVRNVVRTNPDVIFAITTRMVLDLIAVTTAIPIICITPDPIATGLVANLARPGGNVTGVSNDAGLEIWAKRLQLLREAVPGISRLGRLASMVQFCCRCGRARRREGGWNFSRRPIAKNHPFKSRNIAVFLQRWRRTTQTRSS
jgi:putative ABC transport system substrate-binding protein